ncbi:MAG: T9SS type A sorting domain-containing protein [candidate division WOR-3 bacterium]|nr:T9SS type A sorting domain-containing protein [candidate division WOR-3 bacterium]
MVRKWFFFPLISALLLVVPEISYAGWTRTYGGETDDVGYCVRQTSDGGFIIAGYSESQGGSWVLKTDEEGDTLWTSTPFWFAGGAAYSVQQTSDGGYILTGYQAATDDGKYHLALVKLDSLGKELWARLDGYWFPHDSTGGVSLSVEQTSDGGYILTGYRQPLIWEEITDLWLIKTDSAGDLEWSRTYGAEGPDCGCCVRQTSDGGYIVAGYATSLGNLWLLKTDESGDTVWTFVVEEGWSGKACSVAETSDDGYIATGYVAPFRDGKYHLYLVKLNSDGDTLWSRMDVDWLAWNTGGVGRCVSQTPDDGYIITGYTSEWDDERTDLFLIKTDEEGDTIWTRIYGGEDWDAGYSLAQTSDGGYIVTGATKSFGAGGYDIWLLKTDASGDTLGVIEELVVDVGSNWYVFSPIGSEIVLRYEDCPQGFHASVFDASGRRVDELHSTEQSGMITWGKCYGPGVYFIRVESRSSSAVEKVILIN